LLTGYTVDGSGATITLHTEPHQGGGEAFIDVVFRGVVAYHFEGDCLNNIVLEIEEVSAKRIIGDGSVFAERARMHGWPQGWDDRKEDAQQFFERNHARLFELECAYGMSGWIAAASMEKVVKPQRVQD